MVWPLNSALECMTALRAHWLPVLSESLLSKPLIASSCLALSSCVCMSFLTVHCSCNLPLLGQEAQCMTLLNCNTSIVPEVESPVYVLIARECQPSHSHHQQFAGGCKCSMSFSLCLNSEMFMFIFTCPDAVDARSMVLCSMLNSVLVTQ